MSKPFRTIKKSAAKSSVSRKTLRSAVKKSSSEKKGSSSAEKPAGAYVTKTRSSAAEKAGAKKSAKNSTTGRAKELKLAPAVLSEYLNQRSVIRPR